MRKKLEQLEWIYVPLLLFLYSMIGYNQGTDLTDTTYSLGNYQFFHEMTGGWKYATYLSNAIGSVLFKITNGQMIWMNLVTRLLIAGMAILVYFIFRSKMPKLLLVLGEIIAISMCWCPTVILYNYLTYFFLTVGALLLLVGLQKRKKSLLIVAGMLLGINVFVRISNLTQMSLILIVWYDYFQHRKEENAKKYLWQNTGLCILGYVIACFGMLGGMLIVEGSSGYLSMISWLLGLFTSTDSSGGYSMGDMLLTILGNYYGNLKWLAFMGFGVSIGTVMFFVFKGKALRIKRILYTGGVCILFLYFYRNGMFTTGYDNYGSIFCLSVVFLLISILALLYTIIGKEAAEYEKKLAVTALLIIAITPLGSNNHVYTNINNLFLVAPVALFCGYQRIRKYCKLEQSYPIIMMCTSFLTLFLFQGVIFHATFSFHEIVDTQSPRRTITGESVMHGMQTGEKMANAIEELEEFSIENALEGHSAMFYGNLPGAQYLLGMPCAISSTWPDLESFSAELFVKETEAFDDMEELPILVLSPEVAAYVTEDAEGMDYLEMDLSQMQSNPKLDQISSIILEYNYQEIFGNEEFVLMEGRRND